jgi:tRNA U55 pseudouridine synthase TruB
MTSLVRTGSGSFSLENSITLDELQQLKNSGRLEEAVIPVDSVFASCLSAYPEGRVLKAVLNGNSVTFADMKACIKEDPKSDVGTAKDDTGVVNADYDSQKGDPAKVSMIPDMENAYGNCIRVYADGEFLALYEPDPVKKIYKVRQMFGGKGVHSK